MSETTTSESEVPQPGGSPRAKRSRGPFLLSGFLIMLYMLFSTWYHGCSSPITQEEAKAYHAKIKKNKIINSKLAIKFAGAFAKKDTGKEFFMLNLIRYRKKALYKKGQNYDVSALEANQRYGQGMLPLLVSRGCHPVMVGKPAGIFLDIAPGVTWDRMVIVRYRSRRDFMDIVTSDRFRELVVHKWASIEKTYVIPIETHLPFLRPKNMVFWFLFVIGMLIHFIFRKSSWYVGNDPKLTQQTK